MNFSLTVPKVLQIIALICFIASALGLVGLVAAGLAFWVAADIVSD